MSEKKKITKKELKRLEKRERNRKDKEWRLLVKDRDGDACVICKDPVRVNVHHIIPREIKGQRHNPDNGICLCSKHHQFSREISAHNNPLKFVLWMQENRPEQLKRLIESEKERVD